MVVVLVAVLVAVVLTELAVTPQQFGIELLQSVLQLPVVLPVVVKVEKEQEQQQQEQGLKGQEGAAGVVAPSGMGG